jgi:DNA-binding NarL/FixJ family response regulator
MWIARYHRLVVLAVVDDLLFSSKIRAVADQAGRAVTFVRNRATVLTEIRTRSARLVILDLDRMALDPMATIREIKAHRDLNHVVVVGFVSHVHTETIEAAREAGIDLVLARSAFVAKLPELIASTARQAAGSAE